MQTNIVGWDIGGAHLKAALLEKDGLITGIRQEPCELWRGLDQLEQAAREIMASLPVADCWHVITMTGELVDLFTSRDEGVARIMDAMQRLLPAKRLLVYAGKAGVLKLDDITPQQYASIASANWLASAGWAAQQAGNGLFIDIGSTTTDILLLADGEVCPQGYTDYERLLSRELVYTGIIRTPVMAVCGFAEDRGHEIGLMAEYFATLADVYRLTGELNEEHDQTSPADGGQKTPAASAKRLARMIGCDYYASEQPRWLEFARDIKRRQLILIRRACEQHLKRSPQHRLPLIGAGVGRFLVKQLAEELQLPYIDFSSLFQAGLNMGALAPADCAPAVAVAALMRSKFPDGLAD